MTSIPPPPSDAISETIEEGAGRYVPFIARVRTALVASAKFARYSAYASEAGEAFRPLVSPAFVKGAYAISWTYILGDVGYAGWRANQQSDALLRGDESYDNLTPAQKVELKRREFNEGKMLENVEEKLLGHETDKKTNIIDPRVHGKFTHVGFVMARRAVFQSIASMALPAFTVHSVVRYSAPLFKNAKPKVKRFGPTVMGLATIPALPIMFDEPVEHVIDYLFDGVEHFLFSSSNSIQDEKKKAESKLSGLKNKTEETVEKNKGKLTELKNRTEENLEKSKDKLDGLIQSTKDSLDKSGLVSKALILGVGVDILYLPRLKNLVNRHSSRILNQISKVGLNQTSVSSSSIKASSVALDRFAKRVLCEKEIKEWQSETRSKRDEERLKWLAVRWTSKESLYKSLYPTYKLNWKEIHISKAEDGRNPKPMISFSEEWFQRNNLQNTKTINKMGEGNQSSPKEVNVSDPKILKIYQIYISVFPMMVIMSLLMLLLSRGDPPPSSFIFKYLS